MNDSEIQTQVDASHKAFTEWSRASDATRILVPLTARLSIALRDAPKTKSFIEDVITFAEVAYTAGMLHAQEKPNAAKT